MKFLHINIEKLPNRLGTVQNICDVSIQEAEAGGWQVVGSLGYRLSLSESSKQTKQKTLKQMSQTIVVLGKKKKQDKTSSVYECVEEIKQLGGLVG